MRTLSLTFLLLISGFVMSMKVDRMPSIYVVMSDADSTIKSGKALVKFKLNTPADEAYYRVLPSKEWIRMKRFKGKEEFELTMDAEKYVFKFMKQNYVTAEGYVELIGQNFYEVQVQIYKPKVIPNYPAMSRKPAIYLYSKTPVDLNLSVQPNGTFNYVYPTYNGSWDVHVDGNQLSIDSKQYDYLFWEGLHESFDFNEKEGYVVAKKDINTFLESKLDFMGFNAREKQDFICYWGPILSKNELNKIHFLTGEAYDSQVATYESSVKMDSELRMLMLYQAIDQPEEMIEQKLPQIDREGLTLIEWGGAEMPSIKFN